ncbi:MAG: hypothetical protein ACOY3Y_12435 [Acidobacteriota bacterium]
MIRIVIRLGGAALFLCACAAAWWWWFTAPPRSATADLAALAAEAQPDADGILVVGEPARARRWLARHPQALLPLALAAPQIAPALRRLAPAAEIVARRAEAGIVLWWRGGDVALASPVDEKQLRSLSLAPLAAAFGLHYAHATTSEGGGLVFVTTGPGLLDGRGRPALPPDDGLAVAICRIKGTWWRASATRDDLRCTAGAPPALPSLGARSRAVFSDLRRHLPAVAALGGDRPLALAVAMDARGWALRLPGVAIPSHIETLLKAGTTSPDGGAPGPRRWQGFLGDVWVDPRGGLALGTSPERLAEIAGLPVGDTGAVRPAEVAGFAESAAHRLEEIPGLGREASALRAFSRSLAGLTGARWDIGAENGHVHLEW